MDCDYNLLTWKKPSENFYKLNVDGFRSSTSGKIGFQINLGIGVIVDAEVWGIYFGLKLARNLNIMHLEIESDSAILINLLQRVDLSCHPLGSLIVGCHFLSSNMENTKFSHIFRKCNMITDSLAKMSINHAPGLIILEEPPIHAVSAYLDDLNGVVRGWKTGDLVAS
ncbi:PREDICTED: putative ribonuclease H protein At1g65750-like [Fragaria vesca subsp. vesca]